MEPIKLKFFHFMKKFPLWVKKSKGKDGGPMMRSQIAFARGEGVYHIAKEMRLRTCDAIMYRGSLMGKLQSKIGTRRGAGLDIWKSPIAMGDKRSIALAETKVRG